MPKVAHIWSNIQAVLFPHLERCLETKLTEQQRQLVAILEIVRIEQYVPSRWDQRMGRRRKDRRAIARAFVAKAVYDLPTTTRLIEMLKAQPNLLSFYAPAKPRRRRKYKHYEQPYPSLVASSIAANCVPCGRSAPNQWWGLPSICSIMPTWGLRSRRPRCLGGRCFLGEARPAPLRIRRTEETTKLRPSSSARRSRRW